MSKDEQRILAIVPQFGDHMGPWRIIDRLVAWDAEHEGWSLDVWAVDQDGNERRTQVIVLAPMLDDPKAAAYLEVILEESLR